MIEQDFQTLLDDLIETKVNSMIKEKNFCRIEPGRVTNVHTEKKTKESTVLHRYTYDIDLGNVTLENIMNKGKDIVQKGNDVLVMVLGDNYSNCFIIAKMGKEEYA